MSTIHGRLPAAHSIALEYTLHNPIGKRSRFRAGEPRNEACRLCAALFIGNGTEWIDSIPGFMVLLSPSSRIGRCRVYVKRQVPTYVSMYVPNNSVSIIVHSFQKFRECRDDVGVSKAPLESNSTLLPPVASGLP